MRKIYKYPLEIKDVQTIEMPTESKILSVGVQSENGGFLDDIIFNEQPVIWVLVDLENYNTPKTTIRTIHIIGTGNPIPEIQLKFIGTVQMSKGLVWHVFEQF